MIAAVLGKAQILWVAFYRRGGPSRPQERAVEGAFVALLLTFLISPLSHSFRPSLVLIGHRSIEPVGKSEVEWTVGCWWCFGRWNLAVDNRLLVVCATSGGTVIPPICPNQAGLFTFTIRPKVRW